jgi:hypothetical protein
MGALDYWSARRAAVVEWLPRATRGELEAFALRHHDRAEAGAWCIAEGHERDALTSQREASYAVSDAVDWTAQSRRPSHATLQRRRGAAA